MALDPSFEKLSQAQSGSQIAIWNKGKSWLAPLQFYARISTSLRSTADRSLASGDADRRFLFFRWEVEALIARRIETSNSSIELLNSVFFGDLGFRCSGTPTSRGSDRPIPMLETVLARRTGPSSLIAILYAWTGELVVKGLLEQNRRSEFVRVELVQCTPTEVVRLIPQQDRGEVWLVDISSSGSAIDESTWSEWCSSSDDGFQRLTWAQGMIRSLTDLFHSFDGGTALTVESLTSQLFVLDQIMALQPSDTRRWADRARLNARRGDNSGALDDLKRFFAFHDRDTAPPPIVALYDTLRN